MTSCRSGIISKNPSGFAESASVAILPSHQRLDSLATLHLELFATAQLLGAALHFSWWVESS